MRTVGKRSLDFLAERRAKRSDLTIEDWNSIMPVFNRRESWVGFGGSLDVNIMEALAEAYHAGRSKNV